MLMRLIIVNKISKKPVYTKDFDPKEKWKERPPNPFVLLRACISTT